MICRNCGNRMPDDSKFCDKCGEPLRRPEKRYDYEDDYGYRNYPRDNRPRGGGIINGILILLAVVAVCATIFLALNMFLPRDGGGSSSSKPAVVEKRESSSNDSEPAPASNSGKDPSEYYYAADYYSSNYSDPNGYLFPGSDSMYIDAEELSGCSSEQLGYIRNEIFARHGYAFETDKYISYFGSKNWYYVDYSVTDNTSGLNSYEKRNVELIKSME